MPAILTAGKFKTKNYTILGESAGNIGTTGWHLKEKLDASKIKTGKT
jgi:hypothetical protein